MSKLNRYVFDLDNTLVYTDFLNNYSYNFALSSCGLSRINHQKKRITRDLIFNKYSNLTDMEKNQIISLKQDYFINNLKKTVPNEKIIKILNNQEAKSCILWTSADKSRALAILEYYNIYDAFGKMLFSSKVDLKQDIKKISKLLGCKMTNLIFYEDDINIIRELQRLKLKVNILDLKLLNNILVSHIE